MRMPARVGRSRLGMLVVITLAGTLAAANPVDPDLATADRQRVTGAVTNRAGQPLAGTAIFAATGSLEISASVAPELKGQATTDPAGEFRLAWNTPGGGRGIASLWVYHPGYRLHRATVTTHPTDPGRRIVLDPVEPLAAAAIEVVGSRQEPVNQAEVVPSAWFEGNTAVTSARVWPIPRPVGNLVARRTEPDGRVLLEAIPALRLAGVLVESAAGEQRLTWDETLAARSRIVRLTPVGRVVGQVIGTDRLGVAGLVVRISTTAAGHLVGSITATTDAAGHFEAAGVVAGRVEVGVEPPPGRGQVPERVFRQVLEPGETLSCEIALRPGVRVVGQINEQGTNTGIGGAWVTILGPNDAATSQVQTDPTGRFTAITLAGRVAVQVDSVPPPYVLPDPESLVPRVEVKAEAAEIAWPTIELPRGIVIQGQVQELGHPAEIGVEVEARWVRRDGRLHDEVLTTTLTVADGQFALGPVAATGEVVLLAHRPGNRSGPPIRITASRSLAPVVLALSGPGTTFQPTGRVLDSTGRPVAGALIQFRVADPRLTARGPKAGHRIATEGLDAVVTDEQGRYAAPGHLDGKHRYFAAAEADGYELGRTRSVTGPPANGSTLRFPDLIVDRLGKSPVFVGQVIGTDERPIPGVLIRDNNRHEVLSGDQGWFRLPGAEDGGTTFLFAEHPGYRFAGRALVVPSTEADHSIRWVLTRTDEPVADDWLADRDRRRLIRQGVAAVIREVIVAPWINRTVSHRDPVILASLLERLAEVEPDRVARWLEAGTVTDHRVADALRRIAARRIAGRDFARATMICEAIEDPAVRCHALVDATRATRSLAAQPQRNWLARAENTVRSIENQGDRVEILAQIAAGWLDVGETDRAKRSVAEAEAIAATLPPATQGGRAWCALIEPLARIDPARARQRFGQLLDPTALDQCRLTLALRTARVDPTGAVATFGQIRGTTVKRQNLPELCYRLAPTDPGRARALAETIRAQDPTRSAYALGMVAAGVAATDRRSASATIRESLRRLEATALTAAATTDDPVDPAIVAGLLLPVVEAIDPNLVPEFFWKVLAIHSCLGQRSPSAAAFLALLLSPYDPRVALLICNPGRVKRSIIAAVDLPALLLAAAEMAPDVAYHWSQPVADTDDPTHWHDSRSDHVQLDLMMFWLLAEDGRRDYAALHLLNLWTPTQSPVFP